MTARDPLFTKAAVEHLMTQAQSEADQDGWSRGYGAAAKHFATAWQEGYLRGTLDATSDLEPADNPYLDNTGAASEAFDGIDYAHVLEIVNASADPAEALRVFVEQEREAAK